jgi:ferritin
MKTVQKAINEQINFELASAYIYLAMAAHFEEVDFAGFASWMKKQAEEEVGHAMKLFGYVHERGGSVELDAIAKPPASFESPLAVFKMPTSMSRS